MEWIEKLKVAELKDELKNRGLAVAGKKAELVERLCAHVSENEAAQVRLFSMLPGIHLLDTMQNS
jgi:hypothetical protein